uniref:Uncharacterized protein n=1 Tax=Chromera velia CCMP2878 TaxID=1169474 RepID=A0A0G4F1A0_9ALVE|eukprot:Cvel_2602.t1-p1 / transcript=Cvel_2602.t1 / gene=Cvel_2602 / organism=Chromera_velia_CCMP2878 / gene_product=hypothetical protein / transcript_product=hypothetical protein / location=Cvel_scaffold103:13585-15579(+) / protein_length=665 / sequence_SO=supercontig / SO=protein_coding / is_pseudo=false
MIRWILPSLIWGPSGGTSLHVCREEHKFQAVGWTEKETDLDGHRKCPLRTPVPPFEFLKEHSSTDPGVSKGDGTVRVDGVRSFPDARWEQRGNNREERLENQATVEAFDAHPDVLAFLRGGLSEGARAFLNKTWEAASSVELVQDPQLGEVLVWPAAAERDVRGAAAGDGVGRVDESEAVHAGWGRERAEGSVPEILLLRGAEEKRRVRELIDLAVLGKAYKRMGDKVILLGWARAASFHGWRVRIFAETESFFKAMNARRKQLYLVDSRCLRVEKVRESLKRLTEKGERGMGGCLKSRFFVYNLWGGLPENLFAARERQKRGGRGETENEHFVLSKGRQIVSGWRWPGYPENTPIGILPSLMTFWGLPAFKSMSPPAECCLVFFMGKNEEDLSGIGSVLELLNERLGSLVAEVGEWGSEGGEHWRPICMGVKVKEGRTLAETVNLKSALQYTRNLGVMDPLTFSALVGSARVVVGSGAPIASPTIVDAVVAQGHVFAPRRQFCNPSPGRGCLGPHERWTETDELTSEEIVERIVEKLRGLWPSPVEDNQHSSTAVHGGTEGKSKMEGEQSGFTETQLQLPKHSLPDWCRRALTVAQEDQFQSVRERVTPELHVDVSVLTPGPPSGSSSEHGSRSGLTGFLSVESLLQSMKKWLLQNSDDSCVLE